MPVSILHIEDSPTETLQVQAWLADQWPDVPLVQVADMQAALAALGEQVFTVILLDLTLPDVSGLAGIPLLYTQAHGAAVIVLTSREIALAPEARRLGAMQYVQKSNDPASLYAALEPHLA